MRVSKLLAILIGLFTVWPPVYMLIFFSFILGSFMRLTNSKDPADPFRSFRLLMAAHLATMLIMMVLLVFYIVHVFKNPALVGDKRVLWAVVLFMGNIVAMPIYWFLYVWREPVSSAIPLASIPSPPSTV
jgi:hypothetical protein